MRQRTVWPLQGSVRSFRTRGCQQKAHRRALERLLALSPGALGRTLRWCVLRSETVYLEDRYRWLTARPNSRRFSLPIPLERHKCLLLIDKIIDGLTGWNQNLATEMSTLLLRSQLVLKVDSSGTRFDHRFN
jgi:hypothetical protein